MAFCSNCGAQMPDNQRFCSQCGVARDTSSPAAPAPGAQRPAQNPNAQRPAQVNRTPNGPDYTTYIPKTSPVNLEKTTYLPRRAGDTTPQQGHAQPQQGYAQPQQGYAQPQQGYAQPQQGYAQPQQGYAQPQQGYAQPQQGYAQPQQGYAQPQQSYAAPQQNYNIPQQPAAQPQQPVSQQEPAGEPNKKKPRKGKAGIIVLILVLLAALGVGAFFLLKDDSGSSDTAVAVDGSILGVYGAVDADGNDIKGEWLELMGNGKGELRLDGETYKFKWELDGEDLTVIQSKDEYTGTLIDGHIVLDINGDIFTYRHEDWVPSDEETPAQVPTEAPVETQAPVEEDPNDPNDLAFWEGDYYGWWIVNDVYEGDSDDEGSWWDCFANVTFNRDGTAWVTVWDEDGSRSEPLGEIKMEITLVDYGVVEFNSISGAFGGCDVEYGQWYCRSDDDEDFDQTFWISATYNDGEGLHFDYTFYMRPWGHDWKDIAQEAPDLLPGYYEDWYLPLIESGVKKAPDSIN